MGYRIYMADWGGLTVPADKVPGFADAFAKNLMAKDADSVLKAPGVSAKVVSLHALLDKERYPFDVSLRGDGSLEVSYYMEEGEYWWENAVKAFLNAFAPHAPRNAYLGFVGEDMRMWSYVFDGTGSYHEVSPEIDWTGTRIKDDDGDDDEEGDSSEEGLPSITFTPESMATKEDWETVCEVADVLPDEAESVTLYVADADYEPSDDEGEDED